jgi:hypothetical protein
MRTLLWSLNSLLTGKNAGNSSLDSAPRAGKPLPQVYLAAKARFCGPIGTRNCHSLMIRFIASAYL